MNDFTIINGNCLNEMRKLPENSVDAIVCDPPYGLEFMGNKWDYEVPSVDVWRECLRVLKPGGHLLAFAGTRTQHRMACNIEDAGFDIRDMIAWVYGSGFPKSLDVSKAIDKRRASNDAIRPWLKSLGNREQLASACGVTTRQIDHYLGENTPCPQTLPEDKFIKLCQHFGDVPEWAEDMYAAVGEKLGQMKHARSGGNDFAKRPNAVSSSRVVDITAPATDAAKQWDGWGTALKPAMEPITVARKPLCGTVAENVLRHGTGAINVDGCRVVTPHSSGRWPANLIHDGSDEVVGLFPDNIKGGTWNRTAGARHFNNNGNPTEYQTGGKDSSIGSAARFFYCAKANKADREEGNHHPTVKPTALMQYLVRLVCAKGGTVLDPFMGSGSTGKGALLEGCKFIGIDLNADYCKIADRRLTEVTESMSVSLEDLL